MTDEKLDKALDAIADCIGDAVRSNAIDRFAVARRLGNLGQALMRERSPNIDAYLEDEETAYGVENPVYMGRRRRRRELLPDDNVDTMREIMMLLQGQMTTNTEAQLARVQRDRAAELRDLVNTAAEMEGRGQDATAVKARVQTLLGALDLSGLEVVEPTLDSGALSEQYLKTTGTEIKEETACSGTSPATTETSVSPPSPGNAAASS